MAKQNIHPMMMINKGWEIRFGLQRLGCSLIFFSRILLSFMIAAFSCPQHLCEKEDKSRYIPIDG
ncbi:hypothetical protein Lalb_Chr01g0017351 [Lupinus albus]|uniref:Uncharacterized protein n=1 Tax=Lupinus albus TaxID=3870 RepID=A0A6A4R8H1_LUPAL|nr:hypothetical protein Lalb_Chr01g0017351 [Lupinus albus]